MTTNTETLELEIFRAGDYGQKGNYTANDLDRIANDYDPANHEAPITLDHNQTGPADGWVATIRRAGDRLVATMARLSPRLRELLANGAYKKRSIELYRRFAATGRPYLKAVTFLGAAAPEVKGLADPLFHEQTADSIVFDEDNETPQQQSVAEKIRQRLIEARRWNPAWEEQGLLAIFDALGESETIDNLVTILSEQQPCVAFDEASTTALSDFTENYNGNPSPESINLHRQALAHLAQNPSVSYTEALLAVSR